MLKATSSLSPVLRQFPPVRFAFAYGSGVFEQPLLAASAAASKPTHNMLDFIFAVDNPETWHAENIARNRHHYSFLASFGPSAVVRNANWLGVGVHFNTTVPWGSETIKYGVVAASTLLRDLWDWNSLYIAGRLQKPILPLMPLPASIATAQAANLDSALAMGLLLAPRRFTTQDLYRCICALSYMGDVRMALAEDSRKVDRIARGSAPGLDRLYLPRLAAAQALADSVAAHAGVVRAGDSSWAQADSAASREWLIAHLPLGVLHQLACTLRISPAPPLPDSSAADPATGSLLADSGVEAAQRTSAERADCEALHGSGCPSDTMHSPKQPENEATHSRSPAGGSLSAGEPAHVSPGPARPSEAAWTVAAAAVTSGRTRELLRSAVARIVGPSSRGQALAGFFAAGPLRSLAYVWHKLQKGLAST